MDEYNFSLLGYSLARALCALAAAFGISYLIVLSNSKCRYRILRLWRILMFYIAGTVSAGLLALVISPSDAEFYCAVALSLYIYFGFLMFEKIKSVGFRRWALALGSTVFLSALTFYPIAESSDARSLPIVIMLLAFVAELIYTFNITIRVWSGINYEGSTKEYRMIEEILLWILMGASVILVATMAKTSPDGVGNLSSVPVLLEQSAHQISR